MAASPTDSENVTPGAPIADDLTVKESAREGKRGKPGLLARIVFLIMAVGVGIAAAWWLGPWSAPYRYQHMDLVSLRQLIDQSPRNELAWRTLGLRLAREGDAAMAGPALEQAYLLNPSDPEVATGLGEILMAGDHTAEAFQILKAATARNPNSISVHMALGRLYRRKASYQHASTEFEAVTRIDAKDAEAWYELAVCYLQTQQAAKAQAAIDASLRLQPDLPRFLALKGSIDAAVGNIDAGLDVTRKAAQRAPTSLKIQTNYANMLLVYHRNDQDLNEAEQVIGLVEQLDPQYSLLAYQHGELERLRGHWPQAVRYLERALQTAPEQDEVYYALSQAYRRVQRTAEADKMQAIFSRRQSLHRQIEETRIAVSTHPEDTTLYERLADLQVKLGDLTGALNSVKAGLEFAPQQASLKSRLAELQRSLGTPQRKP